MIDQIVNIQRGRQTVPWTGSSGQIYVDTYPGEILTMKDGSRWFHPYSGGAPTKLEKDQVE